MVCGSLTGMFNSNNIVTKEKPCFFETGLRTQDF
jgi:hypothetical protein